MILLPVVSLISFQCALILPSLLVLRWVDKRERWETLWRCVSFEVWWAVSDYFVPLKPEMKHCEGMWVPIWWRKVGSKGNATLGNPLCLFPTTRGECQLAISALLRSALLASAGLLRHIPRIAILLAQNRRSFTTSRAKRIAGACNSLSAARSCLDSHSAVQS